MKPKILLPSSRKVLAVLTVVATCATPITPTASATSGPRRAVVAGLPARIEYSNVDEVSTGSSGCGQQPAPGSHCVTVPVQVAAVVHTWTGHCEQMLVMQVPLLKGIVS